LSEFEDKEYKSNEESDASEDCEGWHDDIFFMIALVWFGLSRCHVVSSMMWSSFIVQAAAPSAPTWNSSFLHGQEEDRTLDFPVLLIGSTKLNAQLHYFSNDLIHFLKIIL
jgi:hypothetical protein